MSQPQLPDERDLFRRLGDDTHRATLPEPEALRRRGDRRTAVRRTVGTVAAVVAVLAVLAGANGLTVSAAPDVVGDPTPTPTPTPSVSSQSPPESIPGAAWLGKGDLGFESAGVDELETPVLCRQPLVEHELLGRSGARPEIYSYGLRNPWRFSFDRQTGDLIIADVGQSATEEVNFVRKGKGRGANFGWRVFEGRDRYTSGERASGAVMPVITESHADGNCSITGGVVIRDPGLSAWRGRYIYGDLCRGVLQTAVLSTGRARSKQDRKLEVDRLSWFGEDAQGRVYVTSLGGPVYRLVQR